ncbi:probable glutamate receptor [Schistocerca nitens]|uniref:probable glutamate receptor n=1 Tax=Schistocerca nitens TaxID=7011 RepID=UPI002118DD13|nr:probable glutamate receptor [Schistocerca nitens]
MLTRGGQLLEARGPIETSWAPVAALSPVGHLSPLPRPPDDLQAVSIVAVTKTVRSASIERYQHNELDVHEVEDGEWGKQNPSGKWSGVVGELADGKVQLAVCSLIITTDRLDVIDFSTPVYETRESVFVRWPDPEGDSLQASVTRLGTVFQAEAWAAVGAALAASSICLCLLGRPKDAVLRAVAALCSQGMLVDAAGGDVGGGARRRVVVAVLAMHLCGSCLLAAYSGRLTALQAVRRVRPPFRGLQGLLDSPQYTLGLIRGSRLDALFSVYAHIPTGLSRAGNAS